MDNVQYDWVAIVIAAILFVVINAVWYSKYLFGASWKKLAHPPVMKKNERNKRVALNFLVGFVIAFFLAFFNAYLGVTTVSDGMFVGFCAWLGFVATTQINSVIWFEKPFKLFVIKTAGKLVSYLVMGGLLGA